MLRRLLVLVLTVCLLAAACGGSNDDAQEPPAQPDAASQATPAPPEPAASPVEPTSPAEPTPAAEAEPIVYDAPGELSYTLPLVPGDPGTIIDTEQIEISGAIAERILYHSQSATGENVAVSGFYAYPDGEPPADGWPLVAWAHGTVGLGDSCAPSHNAETDAIALGLTGFGYAVVATDFEGLGTAGTHPYIVGASEGQSVLDSVRAVQQLGLPVTDEWVAFGHSQGGHAAVFTAQIQPDYAPELQLIGTVAGAPPSQLGELNDALIGGDFQGYLVMSAAGLAAADPSLDLADVMTDQALEMLDVVETGCTAEIFDVYNNLAYDDVIKLDDPFSLPAWSAATERNDTSRLPVTQPMFIIHGGDDEQIPVETSATLLGQLCAFDSSAPLTRTVYPGESHAGVLTNFTAVPDLLAWVGARFDGAPAPDDCAGGENAVEITAPSIDELIASGEPLNIAHAGGDQQSPHSTLFAFAEAVAAGADVLELDVLLTADGVLIAQHDTTLDKTTNETGPVSERTLAELDALDNAYWFSPTCWPCQDRPVDEYIYRGVRTGDVAPPDGYTADDFSIATLREVSDRFPELPLDIEIKGDGDQAFAVAEALAQELTELNRLESSIVVSFDDNVIDAFHAAAPSVEISPGTNRIAGWLLTNTPLDEQFRILQIPPSAQGLEVANAENIARAQDEGLTVWVWPDDAATQENEDFYIELLLRGADGVIAGRPLAMEAATSAPR